MMADAHSLPTLAQIDADGAIEEALDAAVGSTRSQCLRSVALGSAALIAGLSETAEAAPSAKQDTAILNYALAFEYLQAGSTRRPSRSEPSERWKPSASGGRGRSARTNGRT